MTARFAELLASPGVEEVVELRSSFGFLAFHGGSLERTTDVIAAEAARRAGASLYAVVQPADLRWHLPSSEVDVSASVALGRFLGHVEVAVALHGYGRRGRWRALLLGGTNRSLASHLRAHLAPALLDHEVVDDLDAIPPELRGVHPRNPVNRPPAGGVQLELPPYIRGLTPHWDEWQGPRLPPPTEALVEALAHAAVTWKRESPAGGRPEHRRRPSSCRDRVTTAGEDRARPAPA